MIKQPDTSQKASTEAQCLSQLLDDECSSSAIDQVLSNTESSEAWFRYNTIQSVLNKEHSVHSSFDFTQKISALIDQEPAIIAVPSNKSDSSTQSKPANVIPFWKKAGGGLAIAASVAYAMVFSVQMMNKTPEVEAVNQAQLTQPLNQTLLANESLIDNSVVDPQDIAEQMQLDAIQSLLNQERSGLNISEQQVGAELTYSTVIKMEQLKELENQVNNMKKPSEASEKKK